MIVVSGSVILADTAVPIPNLLIALSLVDSGAGPAGTPEVAGPLVATPGGAVATAGDGPGAAAPAGAVAVAIPSAVAPNGLGTQLTDGGGGFRFELDDTVVKVATGEAKRPALLLSVLAPEDPGSTVSSRVLFSSQDLRPLADGTEQQFLVRVPGDALTKAGIPLPVDPSVAKEPSQTVIGKMKQAIDYHVAIAAEGKTIAAQQVEAVRANAQQIDSAVEGKLLESFTGVSAAEAAQLNIVLPGDQPQPTVWNTVNRTIEQKVNPSTIAGYVVFSEQEADRFKDANGNFRDHIPADEIEQYIFQADDAQRTVTILRSDPVAAACRAKSASDPLATPPAGTPTPDPAGNGQPPADQPLTAQDLPKFIGRLVAPIVAPEEALIPARPTAADVESSIGALQVAGGPADVTAF